MRIHLLLLLFAALAVGVTIDRGSATGAMTAGVLLLSVVIHEAAHCFAALRLGGQVEGVVLSPIGGLQAPKVPDEPEPQLFVAMIGPMANLSIAVLAAVLLIAGDTPPGQVLPLLNPVSPSGLLEGSLAVVTLKQTLWINWTLLLLNLLPAYPFDGGPALRATLWPLVGRRTAAVATAYTAQGVALLLCVLAVLVEKSNPQAVMPLWAPLVTLAIFLFFSAQRDLTLAHTIELIVDPSRRYPRMPHGQDLADPDWPEDPDEMVLVEHNQEGMLELGDHKREADEASEDARVDDILARLHTTSFEKLSAEDRAVLQRASRRYRSRQQEADDSHP